MYRNFLKIKRLSLPTPNLLEQQKTKALVSVQKRDGQNKEATVSLLSPLKEKGLNKKDCFPLLLTSICFNSIQISLSGRKLNFTSRV